MHISHERNESENIPILVEARGDAFRGIPKLIRLSLLEYLLGVPWEIPKLELLPLLLFLIPRPPRSSNTSSTQNLNELLVAGLVKMATKSHHVLLQHYCIIIKKITHCILSQFYGTKSRWLQQEFKCTQIMKL